MWCGVVDVNVNESAVVSHGWRIKLTDIEACDNRRSVEEDDACDGCNDCGSCCLLST